MESGLLVEMNLEDIGTYGVGKIVINLLVGFMLLIMGRAIVKCMFTCHDEIEL